MKKATKKTVSKKQRRVPANRNARIESYKTGTGSIRTMTGGRDDNSLKASVITQPATDRTTFFIGRGEQSLILNGREARTLYRVLENHYVATSKRVGA